MGLLSGPVPVKTSTPTFTRKRALLTSPRALPSRKRKSRGPRSLLDLPPEIITYIFVLAGLGRGSELHLTCKSLSSLLRPNSVWWVRQAVEEYTRVVGPQPEWESKLLLLQEKITKPETKRQIGEFISLSRLSSVVDGQILLLKFMDDSAIQMLNGLPLRTTRWIEQMQEQGVEVLEHRYLQFSLLHLQDMYESDRDNAELRADVELASKRLKHFESSYTPETETQLVVPNEPVFRVRSGRTARILQALQHSGQIVSTFAYVKDLVALGEPRLLDLPGFDVAFKTAPQAEVYALLLQPLDEEGKNAVMEKVKSYVEIRWASKNIDKSEWRKLPPWAKKELMFHLVSRGYHADLADLGASPWISQ